jgi:hypothetical protein
MADPTVKVSVVAVGTVLPQVADKGLAPDTWADTGEPPDDELLPGLVYPPPQPDRTNRRPKAVSAGARRRAWSVEMESIGFI